jgi:putative SOS response-associated peptidase YedK
MCAQYTVKGPARAIAERFFASIAPELKEKVYDTRVVPFYNAPVLVEKDHGRVLREMRFHLTPRWAKEPKVKWATYNARLEDVDQKASFKRPFLDNHCVAIINGFVEPIYRGEYAGHMVQFQRTDELWLLAAGIYEEWVNPETGEILESFALLTDPPEDFVAKVGHDRQPIFLAPDDFGTWLSPK